MGLDASEESGYISFNTVLIDLVSRVGPPGPALFYYLNGRMGCAPLSLFRRMGWKGP